MATQTNVSEVALWVHFPCLDRMEPVGVLVQNRQILLQNPILPQCLFVFQGMSFRFFPFSLAFYFRFFLKVAPEAKTYNFCLQNVLVNMNVNFSHDTFKLTSAFNMLVGKGGAGGATGTSDMNSLTVN